MDVIFDGVIKGSQVFSAAAFCARVRVCPRGSFWAILGHFNKALRAKGICAGPAKNLRITTHLFFYEDALRGSSKVRMRLNELEEHCDGVAKGTVNEERSKNRLQTVVV